MEIVLGIFLSLLSVTAMWCGWQWYAWRKLALEYNAFIKNPNITAVDKQAEYKDSFEAKLNALSAERAQIHEAMTEAFDYLNDNGPFGSHDEGLKQVRNVLLYAIQNSTYGRG